MPGEIALGSTFKLLSGHTIPLLGLGVFQNRDACKESCLAAFNAGYVHVDSAQVYRNEEQVGQAVKESGIPREKLFITSKITSRYHGFDKTLSRVRESVDKFALDYLDLFLIHDPLSGKDKRLETWRGLIQLRDEGLLKSIGVSNYNVHHLEEIKSAGLETPSVNQIELHPFCQQQPIVEYCRLHGILVQAYTPLVQAKPGKIDHPVLKAVGEKYGKEPAQILIRWSLQKGYCPLPKSARPERIRSNADVYDFALSKEDMDALDSLGSGKEAGAVTWNPVNAA